MMLLLGCSLLVWFGCLPPACSGTTSLRVSSGEAQPSTSNSPLEVFQVYQPIPFDKQGRQGCDIGLLLMDHVFAYSYGHPFVGEYEPPSCVFDTVRINLTVTSKGRQYDRLGLMYLGDAEVFRTSTAEPTADGIIWTYIKDLSMYISLWKEPQKLIFDLGNLVNNIYTGSYNVTLTAHFSLENNMQMADIILPISAQRSSDNAASAFIIPEDNATVLYQIPAAASRAVVSISACGQATEEFWWSNALSSDTQTFMNTVGELYGYSPFREIQLYIDGILAGVVWPFPILFTGGVAPGFWRPIVGIDAFDLRQPEIDISPFLPWLTNGQAHSFTIQVVGLDENSDGSAILSQTVGSYWVVTGTIFLYFGNNGSYHKVAHLEKSAPTINAPPPAFTVSSHLIQNEAGVNESLSYSVIASRTLSVTSSQFTWNQKLAYSNHGFLNQQGVSQVNHQSTSGELLFTGSGQDELDKITFNYPLIVNSTYGITDNSLSIDAWMRRALEIDATGVIGLSTYTLSSGPSLLQTSQWGHAEFYQSNNARNSTSSDRTTDIFLSHSGGQSYARSVEAVNGTVVEDTEPHGLFSNGKSEESLKSAGRGSVRSMLGRGPGSYVE